MNGSVQDHGPLDVYIFGLLRPLDDDQWVTLRSGMTICCVPRGQGPVPGWNLDDMLQDPTEWEQDPAIPGPPPAPGNHYLVLTDAMPYLFKVTPGRRRYLKQDMAQLLQCNSHALTLLPTTPRVIDCIGFGLPTWTVLVATEQLQVLPCPPARQPERRIVLVLDCRAILMDFQWRLLHQPTIAAQTLADQFADRCPASHLVVFRGTDMHHTDEGYILHVSHGQVIKVEFVEESEAGTSSDDNSVDHPGSDASMHTAEVPPASDAEASVPHSPTALSAEAEVEVARSRSPRGSPAAQDQDHASNPPEDARHRMCVFGILAPGFATETVTVSLPTPALMQETVRLVQIGRAASYAHALPLLSAVRHQPTDQWGLFIATPIWGYNGAVVCIDMTSSWNRIFAVCLPVHAHRHRILAAAGLSAAADVDLFLNGDCLVSDSADLRDGDCLTVVWSGFGPSPRRELKDLLATPWTTAAAPAFPNDHEDDHYILVGIDGCKLFTLLPQRSFYYRADIASRIGCAPSELMLVPGKPLPTDATMHGFSCRNALASLSIGHMPAVHTLCVCLVDARRLMLDWQIVATPGGWLHAPTVLAACGSHLPDSWVAYIVGLPAEQEWVSYDAGEVFQVAGRPTTTALQPEADCSLQAPEVAGADPSPCPSEEHSTREGPAAREVAAPSSSPPASHGNTCSYSGDALSGSPHALHRACHPSASAIPGCHVAPPPTAQAAKCRGFLPQEFQRSGTSLCTSGLSGRLGKAALSLIGMCFVIAVCYVVHCLVFCATANQSPASGTLPQLAGLLAVGPILQTHRHFPMFCLVAVVLASSTTAAATGASHPPEASMKIALGGRIGTTLSASFRQPAAQLTALHMRMIPTPCRNAPPRVAVEDNPNPLMTLLEESLQQKDCPAMFLAATLLDTLTEHFAESHSARFPSESDELLEAVATRPTLCLDKLVPSGSASDGTFTHDPELPPRLGTPPLLVLQPIGQSFLQTGPVDDQAFFGATPLGFSWRNLGQLLDFNPEPRPWSAFYKTEHPKNRQLPAAMQQLREDSHSDCVFCYTDGSFYPATASSPAGMGWACIFVDANVGHCAPRRMLVRLQHGTFRLLIASLHAPHRGWDKQYLGEWWRETQALLHRYGQLAQTILAGDLNASVGSRTSAHIGSVAAEEEDCPGEFWHQALQAMSCFLPCSFEDIQQGPTATYYQKRNGHACRPDMIGIPCAWRNGHITAWIAPELHVAMAHQDHYATCARVSLRLRLPGQTKPTARKRIPANLMTDPAQQAAVRAVLHTAPPVSWSTSAHAHAAILVKHLQEGLSKLVEEAPPKPKHPYIQENTWALQRQVTQVKRALHRVSGHIRTQLQATCLLAWKHAVCPGHTFTCAQPLRCAWMRRAKPSTRHLLSDTVLLRNAAHSAAHAVQIGTFMPLSLRDRSPSTPAVMFSLRCISFCVTSAKSLSRQSPSPDFLTPKVRFA